MLVRVLESDDRIHTSRLLHSLQPDPACGLIPAREVSSVTGLEEQMGRVVAVTEPCLLPGSCSMLILFPDLWHRLKTGALVWVFWGADERNSGTDVILGGS